MSALFFLIITNLININPSLGTDVLSGLNIFAGGSRSDQNHIAAAGTISGAITNARALFPDRRLEVEVESLQQLREAMDAAPDWIMLDNFALDDLRRAVAENNTNIRLEASGGIESDAELISTAETGGDYISIGALTKYVRAVDLSMRFET